MERKGDSLVPSAKAWRHALGEVPIGEKVRVEVSRPRNSRHHRMFFALLQLSVTALNRGPAGTTVDALLDWLKGKLGYYEIVELPPNLAQTTGQSHAVRFKSIRFAAMDQTAFANFADEAMRLIRDEIAPWIDESPEWPEIEDILRRSQTVHPDG